MAQAGFTPVQLYHSTTAAATPSAGNLANGELAINITDGKLYYKDNGGTVRVLAGTGGTGVVAGSNTQIQFNNNGVFGAAAGLTWDGTYLTANSIKDSALTSGRVTYAGTSGLLQDSANLTFDGTTLTANALTVTNATTLNGGTANGVAYLNGSKVLTTGSALTFDGTTFSVLATSLSTPAFKLFYNSASQYGQHLMDANGIYVIESPAANGVTGGSLYLKAASSLLFGASGSEQMRLTSTGLGIGTSSPSTYSAKLAVVGTSYFAGGASSTEQARFGYTDGTSYWGMGRDNVTTGNFILNNAGTTVATFSTSGNLGLGVTPSAWGSGFKAFEVGRAGSGFFSVGTDSLQLTNNYYYNGTNYIYAGNGYAERYHMVSGQHQWFTAPSGTAGNAISFTQAMTLDASGNLSVKTTTARANITTDADLVTQNGLGILATSATYGQGYQYIRLMNSAASYAGGISQTESTGIGLYSASNLILGSSSTERARIDSSGNFLVGTTTGYSNTQGFYFGAGAVSYTSIGHTTAAVSGDLYARFVYNGTGIGSITQNGTTGVLYNLTSDYRLKNNPVALTGSGAFIDALQPKTWDWWDGSGKGVGFIAHEFMEVAKYSGNGEKDAVDADGKPVYQSIQPSSSEVMANLVAEIQSLRKRLAAAGIA